MNKIPKASEPGTVGEDCIIVPPPPEGQDCDLFAKNERIDEAPQTPLSK